MKYASVVIVDQGIELIGVAANVTFVLGLSAGRALPDSTFGTVVVDGDGSVHAALTTVGHHVRKAGQAKLRALRARFMTEPGVLVVDYTDDAAPADYAAYSQSLATRSGEAIHYRALYIFGPEDLVLPLTRNLSRL